jgi:hypothetical protein
MWGDGLGNPAGSLGGAQMPWPGKLGAAGGKKQYGAIAQLGERLPCTQEVRSSILLGSTIQGWQKTGSWRWAAGT